MGWRGEWEYSKTSAFAGIDRILIISADSFLAPVHRATEEAILKTGIPYSFLRSNWYLENETSSIQGVMAGAPWVTSAGTGKVGWALQQDYAEAAAFLLNRQ